MRYIRLENNIPIDYSIEQLFKDYPNAVIYKRTKKPNESLLATYNVYPLITEPKPEVKESEIAVESIPELRKGKWHQTWEIKKKSKQELDLEKRKKQSLIADPETEKYRYNICVSCDSFTKIKTCKKCGCIMPLKVKVATAKCPVGKW
jgi:hypothetical protein